MSCDEYRTALSARLDGEDTGLPAAAIDSHLTVCAACTTWLAQAEQVTRALRARPAPVPDLTAPILAAVRAGEASARGASREQAARRLRIMRLALGLTAAMQLAMAVPMLLGLGEIAHTTREAASFDIALAVGFALAAWRPAWARAFLPVAVVLAGCLTVTSAFDILDGQALFVHEVAHVAALAQAALLWGLSRNNGSMIAKAREAATIS